MGGGIRTVTGPPGENNPRPARGSAQDAPSAGVRWEFSGIDHGNAGAGIRRRTAGEGSGPVDDEQDPEHSVADAAGGGAQSTHPAESVRGGGRAGREAPGGENLPDAG